MLILAPFEQAARTLRANKVRSALTVLGIVIGIASVIILISAGRGAQQLIVKQVQGSGANLIIIIPGGSKEGRTSAPASTQGIVITSLTTEDVRAMMRPGAAPSVQSAAPEVRGSGKLQRGSFEQTVTFIGTTPEYFPVRDVPVPQGGPLTNDDVASLASVVVIGPKLAADAFGDENPVGQSVRIGTRSFRVVGVTAEKGLGAFGIDQDSLALIPVSTAQKLMLGIDYVNTINVQAKSGEVVDQAVAEINDLLKDRHRITNDDDRDFTIRTSKDSLALLETITGALTLFLAAIASISLIVGGIGIMNIMLVAVTERTREIGLRKAVGARRSDILTQFLVEALVLTVVGGLVGIVIGIGVSFLIAKIGGWDPVVEIDAVALATGVSAAFGLVFGLYPANKAAKLNPIDALRYE